MHQDTPIEVEAIEDSYIYLKVKSVGMEPLKFSFQARSKGDFLSTFRQKRRNLMGKTITDHARMSLGLSIPHPMRMSLFSLAFFLVKDAP